MDPQTAEQGLRQQDLAGIKSLLERQCGSAAVAEDLLSEALETSLRKLRDGAIARPEQLVGYVYRVALNLLRNFRRQDKSSRTSSEGIEAIAGDDNREAAASIEQARWAKLMREVLKELPGQRDRELIVAFYLEEEDKEALCRRFGITAVHFNRVIHRARERFRELLEDRGYRRGDFLGLFTVLVG
jgi:RNA polymerase sigma-70 factor, ECF subfamily